MSQFIPYEKRSYGPLNEESRKIIERTNIHSATNYQPYPFVVAETDGPWLIDPTGERAMDFLSAYSAVLSHRHPGIRDAVVNAMHTLDLTSRAVYTRSFADMVNVGYS